jgi:hypothetical protein
MMLTASGYTLQVCACQEIEQCVKLNARIKAMGNPEALFEGTSKRAAATFLDG